MGLFDSVLGAVMNGNAQGQGGGLASIVSAVTSNPQMLQALTGMLGNDGEHGGLGGLVAKFEQAGLGDVVGSWIGKGPNQSISADQISSVLGNDTMSGLAAQLGLNTQDVAGQLSSVLPDLVNHLTPEGQAPQGGLGSGSDLMGMLGSLLKQ